MSSDFNIQQTKIKDLVVLQRSPLRDSRGYIERLFCKDILNIFLKNKNITQINHTLTAKTGTLRGMHFQYPPYTETKLVSCTFGKVFDVAVDLRKGSPTFLHYHAEVLSPENYKTLLIPEGFAHGFQTLTENCEMLYFHTENYTPKAEGGVNAVDQRIGIFWPLKVTEISDRDKNHNFVDDNFEGLLL
jgi:dTDP-4-dehydrorhamnose 3,5-epimerase